MADLKSIGKAIGRVATNIMAQLSRQKFDVFIMN